MGVSHVKRAEMDADQAKRLNAPQQPAEPALRGHGRGRTAAPKADKTDIGLRGVPVIGHGSGAISLTAPGGEIGNAARLEKAGRDIVRTHLAKAARSRMKRYD